MLPNIHIPYNMDIKNIHMSYIQFQTVSRTQNPHMGKVGVCQQPMGKVGVCQQPMGKVGVYQQPVEEKVDTIDMFPEKRWGYIKFAQLGCNECGLSGACACFDD